MQFSVLGPWFLATSWFDPVQSRNGMNNQSPSSKARLQFKLESWMCRHTWERDLLRNGASWEDNHFWKRGKQELRSISLLEAWPRELILGACALNTRTLEIGIISRVWAKFSHGAESSIASFSLSEVSFLGLMGNGYQWALPKKDWANNNRSDKEKTIIGWRIPSKVKVLWR